MAPISWNAMALSLEQDQEAHLLEFFNCPSTFGEAIMRLKHNLYYFRISYSIVILFILFTSLLWNPLAIVVFTIFFFGWLVGYCCNDDPIELINCNVDCRLFLAVLWVLTLFALISTGFWLNVLVSISIGFVLAGIHALFRCTDDLYVELQ
ncbi:PRA1 family protein E-like [Ziziphus jujuba]|uniref:PRA1 family protein n=1 Tax=Ziziphus jujuba TaxID=326968 RepID=A0A6P3YVK5_ZIZJJ|nr:PRA1 family protein E-like [Ziziphus jujuba]